MSIKAKDLKKGFKYTIKGDINQFVYLGKTKYLSSSETLAFKAEECYLFALEDNGNLIYKNISLKNVISCKDFSFDEKKANNLYNNYILDRDNNLINNSFPFIFEVSKLLINPIIADYIKKMYFGSAHEVVSHLHEKLIKELKVNPNITYYNKYESDPHLFKDDIIESYLLFLYNIKYYVTKNLVTDILSNKKLESFLFTNRALVEIINLIEEEENQKIDLKIYKNWVNKADKTHDEFKEIFKKEKDNVIDFSKKHHERTTNLINAEEEIEENYHLYHLKTLFGDVVYFYGNFDYIKSLDFLNNRIIKKNIYKIK